MLGHHRLTATGISVALDAVQGRGRVVPSNACGGWCSGDRRACLGAGQPIAVNSLPTATASRHSRPAATGAPDRPTGFRGKAVARRRRSWSAAGRGSTSRPHPGWYSAPRHRNSRSSWAPRRPGDPLPAAPGGHRAWQRREGHTMNPAPEPRFTCSRRWWRWRSRLLPWSAAFRAVGAPALPKACAGSPARGLGGAGTVLRTKGGRAFRPRGRDQERTRQAGQQFQWQEEVKAPNPLFRRIRVTVFDADGAH